MKLVKAEEFQRISDLEVVHRPTGAKRLDLSIHQSRGRLRNQHVDFGVADDDYDQMEIIRTACELLRESARR
jgi:hypothetical protein